MAEALKAAHEAGVWHRDVKPANLLVRKTARGWEVKVIDFGLSLRRSLVQASQARAASLGRSMVGSAVAGTLHYAAPEQLDPDRSREVGPHSDVFGFGRTCYFALFRSRLPTRRISTLCLNPGGSSGPMHGEADRSTTEGFRSGAGAARGHPGAAHREVDPNRHPPSVLPTSAPGESSTGPRVTAPAVKTTPKTAPAPWFVESLGTTIVRIEPGKFLMGSTKEQIDKLMKQFPISIASGLTPSSRSIRSRWHGRSIWRHIRSRWDSSAGS